MHTAERHVLGWGEYRKVSRSHDGFEMLPECKDLLGRHCCCDEFRLVSDEKVRYEIRMRGKGRKNT
jgi:hypothetical protein